MSLSNVKKSTLFTEFTQTSQCDISVQVHLRHISPVYICMAVYNLQKVHQKDADVRWMVDDSGRETERTRGRRARAPPPPAARRAGGRAPSSVARARPRSG